MPSVVPSQFSIDMTVNKGKERQTLTKPGGLVTLAANTQYMPTGKIAYLGIDPACSSYIVLNRRNSMAGSENLGDFILKGYSFVCAYGMKKKGEEEYSLYLKPVGVDQVYFDSFDDVKYRLEAVATGRNDLRSNVIVMPTNVQMPEYRTTNPFDMSFFRLGSRVQNTYHPGRHSVTTGAARFQLRDLITGLVSPLSSARLRTVERQRCLPFAIKVESHNEV